MVKKNRPEIAKSCIFMLFGALPWQHVQYECHSFAKIYKPGQISATCNISLFRILKFNFLPTHEAEIRP